MYFVNEISLYTAQLREILILFTLKAACGGNDEQHSFMSNLLWFGDIRIIDKVFICEVPVGCVAFDEASDDDKAQHYQVDPSEDLVHQSRLTNTKSKQPWGGIHKSFIYQISLFNNDNYYNFSLFCT